MIPSGSRTLPTSSMRWIVMRPSGSPARARTACGTRWSRSGTSSPGRRPRRSRSGGQVDAQLVQVAVDGVPAAPLADYVAQPGGAFAHVPTATARPSTGGGGPGARRPEAHHSEAVRRYLLVPGERKHATAQRHDWIALSAVDRRTGPRR
jgi:hypothetical protein